MSVQPPSAYFGFTGGSGVDFSKIRMLEKGLKPVIETNIETPKGIMDSEFYREHLKDCCSDPDQFLKMINPKFRLSKLDDWDNEALVRCTFGLLGLSQWGHFKELRICDKSTFENYLRENRTRFTTIFDERCPFVNYSKLAGQ